MTPRAPEIGSIQTDRDGARWRVVGREFDDGRWAVSRVRVGSLADAVIAKPRPPLTPAPALTTDPATRPDQTTEP